MIEERPRILYCKVSNPGTFILYVNEPLHSLRDKDHQKYFFGRERGGVAVDEVERERQRYSVRLRAVP